MQLESGIYQTRKLGQCTIVIRTKTRRGINAVHCSKGIYLSVYLYLFINLRLCV